ncbi:mucin-binding protein [Weissella viridescens]|nr:MucBP domain-containing protein [Weissella viridescens]
MAAQTDMSDTVTVPSYGGKHENSLVSQKVDLGVVKKTEQTGSTFAENNQASITDHVSEHADERVNKKDDVSIHTATLSTASIPTTGTSKTNVSATKPNNKDDFNVIQNGATERDQIKNTSIVSAKVSGTKGSQLHQRVHINADAGIRFNRDAKGNSATTGKVLKLVQERQLNGVKTSVTVDPNTYAEWDPNTKNTMRQLDDGREGKVPTDYLGIKDGPLGFDDNGNKINFNHDGDYLMWTITWEININFNSDTTPETNHIGGKKLIVQPIPPASNVKTATPVEAQYVDTKGNRVVDSDWSTGRGGNLDDAWDITAPKRLTDKNGKKWVLVDTSTATHSGIITDQEQKTQFIYVHETIAIPPSKPQPYPGLKEDDLNKTITRIINYVNQETGKNVAKQVIQKVDFGRTAIYDTVDEKVIGYDTNGDGEVDTFDGNAAWISINGGFGRAWSPIIQGYNKPNLTVVEQKSPSPNDEDEIINVLYEPLKYPSYRIKNNINLKNKNHIRTGIQKTKTKPVQISQQHDRLFKTLFQIITSPAQIKSYYLYGDILNKNHLVTLIQITIGNKIHRVMDLSEETYETDLLHEFNVFKYLMSNGYFIDDTSINRKVNKHTVDFSINLMPQFCKTFDYIPILKLDFGSSHNISTTTIVPRTLELLAHNILFSTGK